MEEKEKYLPSGSVREAASAVAAQKKTKPEAYRSQWEAQLQALMDRILNQEEFNYRLDGDALYRMYRDQAVRNGQRAMADTMGQAAALTGGYGNSYAQSAGQQAYSRQLEALDDRIPELYALALEQYRQRVQGLQDRFGLLNGMENRDYTRYQDALAAWQKEADALWQSYTDSRDFDYGLYRDSVADRKWQTEFNESLRRYEQEWADKHPAVAAAPTYSYTAPAKKKEEEKPAASTSTGPQVVLL